MGQTHNIKQNHNNGGNYRIENNQYIIHCIDDIDRKLKFISKTDIKNLYIKKRSIDVDLYSTDQSFAVQCKKSTETIQKNNKDILIIKDKLYFNVEIKWCITLTELSLFLNKDDYMCIFTCTDQDILLCINELNFFFESNKERIEQLQERKKSDRKQFIYIFMRTMNHKDINLQQEEQQQYYYNINRNTFILYVLKTLKLPLDVINLIISIYIKLIENNILNFLVKYGDIVKFIHYIVPFNDVYYDCKGFPLMLEYILS